MTRRIKELRAELDAALREVTAAEGGLEGLLKELIAAPRAEKVKVTTVVESAFERLRAARAALAKVRDLVDEE